MQKILKILEIQSTVEDIISKLTFSNFKCECKENKLDDNYRYFKNIFWLSNDSLINKVSFFSFKKFNLNYLHKWYFFKVLIWFRIFLIHYQQFLFLKMWQYWVFTPIFTQASLSR